VFVTTTTTSTTKKFRSPKQPFPGRRPPPLLCLIHTSRNRPSSSTICPTRATTLRRSWSAMTTGTPATSARNRSTTAGRTRFRSASAPVSAESRRLARRGFGSAPTRTLLSARRGFRPPEDRRSVGRAATGAGNSPTRDETGSRRTTTPKGRFRRRRSRAGRELAETQRDARALLPLHSRKRTSTPTSTRKWFSRRRRPTGVASSRSRPEGSKRCRPSKAFPPTEWAWAGRARPGPQGPRRKELTRGTLAAAGRRNSTSRHRTLRYVV